MRIRRVTNELQRRASASSRLSILTIGGLHGPGAGTTIDLPRVGVTVGADESCEVVLADEAVSARHLTVRPGEQGFDVEDLGSKNGTWLDGARLHKATVPMGTALRVGQSLLQLLPGEEAVDLPPSERTSFGGLIGASPAMRRVYAVLERASAGEASILFGGESGTGKELAARAVHDHSPRREGPFVVFDCGAASETLIESDLFGHLKGAYTGAQGDRPGAFALAHGGTLFLDEIGDLPLSLQPKLLRLLESGEVTPLGARKPERYQVRVVAATHRDLWEEVARGAFRGDLYYRLAVVELQLPPLRARREDIPDLAREFLRRAGAASEGIQGRNLDRLLAYAWPGNVRELRNVITRAVALSAPGTPLSAMPVLLRGGAGPGEEPLGRADRPFHEAKDALVARFEREYLSDLVTRAGGNLSEAARLAGLERKYLYKLLEKAGLRTSSG
jgi:DNA-binding NtrC family response regulator